MRRADGGSRLALALVAAVALAACGEPERSFRVIAEEEHLLRQVEDLRRLVERAEQGALLPRDAVVVSVSEELVRELLQLTLPREDVVQERFHVRLDEADARFEDGHGTVRLDGRVDWTDDTLGFGGVVSADLTVLGRVEAVGADIERGTLTTRVAPYGFQIHRLRMGEESPRTRRLVESLGQALPEALSTMATKLTIPVAFEHRLRLEGIEAGPVRVAGAAVPLRAVVREASAHGGRLWIVLQVDTGPWARDPW